MKRNIFRLNDYLIAKINNYVLTEPFFKVSTDINSINNQYFQFSDLNDIVWESGDFAHRLNKLYNSNYLFNPNNVPNLNPTDINTIEISLLLKQNFSWKNIFGLLVVVKSSLNQDVLCSKIVKNFQITGNKELIDGSFWLEDCKIKIPNRTNETLLIEVVKIYNSDIEVINTNSLGFINVYPIEFTPLISEESIPDFIKTLIALDVNHYLTITPYTLENKTLEQSILDYFGITMSNIEIQHVINYGVDSIGYKALRIQNELNTFSSINIGLNLLDFSNPNNDAINIYVNTEIYVDGKMMRRDAMLTTTILETINPLIANKIVQPISIYPVNVKNETIVNNTIIETKEEVKIISVIQPIFAELINENIIFELKNIYFTKIVKPALLKLIKTNTDEEQIILSKRTNDNQYYFDLKDLYLIKSNTTYEIIDKENNQLIGKGNFLLKE